MIKHKNTQFDYGSYWHMVYGEHDYDDKPLVSTIDVTPPPIPKPKPIPPTKNRIVYVAAPTQLAAEFMVQLNSRLVFMKQKRSADIPLGFGMRTWIAIEPRVQFYTIPEDQVPVDADVWSFDEPEMIQKMVCIIYNKYVKYTPIQIILDSYSRITQSWFDIFYDRITFFHGKKDYSTNITLDTMEYLANMYDTLFLSPDNRLVIKSYSKHTIYLDKNALGALLLEDAIMIMFLHKTLKKEYDCMKMDIIPNYQDLWENIDKYVVEYRNFIPKKLQNLFDNFECRFVKSEMVQILERKNKKQHEADSTTIIRPEINMSPVYIDEENNIVTPVQL